MTRDAAKAPEPHTTHPARPERALVHRVLAVRQRVHDTNRGRGVLAAFASAIHPMTEANAYPYTESLLGDLKPVQRIGARRVAGMVAVHRDTKSRNEGHESIGSTMRRLHHEEHKLWPGELDTRGNPKRTAMSIAVDTLPLLDVENAAQVLSGFVGRCPKHGIVVDFVSLAATLTFWGTGLDPRSRDLRAEVVQHFYGLSDRTSSRTRTTDTDTSPTAD